MLVGITLHLTQAACDEFILNVWHVIMKRLQGSRTPKFEKALVIGACAIASKYGGDGVAQMLERIQPGLFIMFCNRFIVMSAHTVQSKLGKKCALMLLREVVITLVNSGKLQQDGPKLYSDCVVSATKIIAGGSQAGGGQIINRHFGVGSDNNSSSSNSISTPNNNNHNKSGGFSRVASSNQNLDNVGFSSSSGTTTTSELLSAADIRTNALTETGFTNAFCPLIGAQRDPDDPFPQTENPMRAFIDTVRGHMNDNSQLGQALQQNLPSGSYHVLMNS